MKKRQRACFFMPDKLQNYINEEKGKEEKGELRGGKEEKKKSNGCTFSFV